MNTPRVDGSRGTPPRTVSEIKRQLTELAEVLRKAEKYGARDPASTSRLSSLRKHQSQLTAELKASELLESANDLVFAVDGDPVEDHTIQARFLGAFLAKAQELVNSIAQVLTSVPTSRARIPGNIVAENRLMVAGFGPSSFAVQLRLPKRDEPDLFGESPSQEMLKTLTNMMRADFPTSDLIELVKHSRVQKHYFELLEILAKNGASVRVSTKTEPYGVRLTTTEARNRIELLEILESERSEVEYVGHLVGGSLERSRFELKSEGGLIQGSASLAATEQLKTLKLGSPVQAEVTAVTITHGEGVREPRTVYLLTKITAASEDSPHLRSQMPRAARAPQ